MVRDLTREFALRGKGAIFHQGATSSVAEPGYDDSGRRKRQLSGEVYGNIKRILAT